MTTSLPTVALAGASGDLGKHVVNAFLSPLLRPKFADVIFLSRKPDFKIPGGTTRTYTEENLAESLVGVNVVVNTIGSKGSPKAFKTALLHAIAATPSVTLYLPSEFGVDHTNLPVAAAAPKPDPSFANIEWQTKQEHTALARRLFAAQHRDDIHICHLFVGLMTELSIGPWFGLDTAAGRYTAVGSPDIRASFTALPDIGRAIATLASMSPASCPEYLRVQGDRVSVREIAALMDEAAGVPTEQRIRVESVDLAAYKEAAQKEEQPGPDGPAHYLRVLIGEGKLDFGDEAYGNQNALVNPGERAWKWKTMQDYAIETKGRPWC